MSLDAAWAQLSNAVCRFEIRWLDSKLWRFKVRGATSLGVRTEQIEWLQISMFLKPLALLDSFWWRCTQGNLLYVMRKTQSNPTKFCFFLNICRGFTGWHIRPKTKFRWISLIFRHKRNFSRVQRRQNEFDSISRLRDVWSHSICSVQTPWESSLWLWNVITLNLANEF